MNENNEVHLCMFTDSEETSNQSRELDEEATIDSSVKSENATNQSEDTTTDGSILQESNDTKSSELRQDEVRETRGVISSIWGTSPVTFDEETGVLTVEAGTLGTFVQSQYLDNNSKIIKSGIKSITLQEGVKAPENSHYLFAGYGINLSNLVSISGQLDTSDVKDMSGMFTQLGNLESLSDLNIDSWDIKNVTDISVMFFMNSKLKSINISGWDTSSITNMERAFEGLGYVETIVLGEKSVFNSTVGLPRLYGKFWKRIIPETPESVYLSSDDFMTNYDGTMPGTYILVTNKATLKVKDSTLYVGDNWTAASNFVSATDRDGNELTVADLQIEETVDTTKAGVYEITYKNGNLSETAKVTVKENKTTLKVKDSTLYVGDNWTAASNFISATDKEGNAITVDDLEVEGSVNTSAPGVYEITYKNGSLSETAKVTVKENKATLKVKDSTLYVGDGWTSASNFVSATDKEGNVITVDDLEVEGTVDTKTAGVYEVTYKNGSLSETAKVKVVAKQTGTITLRYVDTYGNPLKDTINGVELEPATFIGNIGESADEELSYPIMLGWILISDFLENIKYEAHPQTYDVVYDNVGVIYISYKDSLGNELKPEERNTDYVSKFDWSLTEYPPVPYEVKPIDIEGYKNTGVEGDPASGSISYYEPTRITFIYDKIDNSAINVHDSTIYTGDDWSPKDNFDGAFDKEGNVIEFQNIKVEGFVNSNQAGIYEVKYSYDGVTSVAKITVKENKTNLKVKDATLSVGDKWSPKDNLVFATDKEGNELTVGDLEVVGTVNISKAGVYEITYKNGSLSKTAKVTVKENKATLKVKDTTLYVEDKWEANDNFISATGKDGNTLKLDELQIEGIVNTKNAGIYEVTYKNDNLSKVAKVTVKEKTFISTSNGNQGGKQSQDKGSKNKQQSTNNSLPKAGEKSALYLSIMGILLLISGLVMMYRKTKIKN
ncbi:bacterial Ig-like domain-containing protein [Listeria monocytogenes]|nr:BspA family leucine-rich repeat surface protein [Listeria monocytogenes serotype 1/2b]EHZ7811899.1 bacterial Ig-like domain-containing protein [Listeria monocytogenes]EAE6139485.1 BspA family leucine-rich repeat surface protein [Listeria monocytogenes serotype 1/2b]EHZ7859431.1 bacterial Ig-like domain-containing protein [Listeria monocytogenes]EHZ7920376.1 bacterial Ig-like domain-containing protein [Listeria monocytogenes]